MYYVMIEALPPPPKKELDIYVPDRKIAIEYDGLIWHRENRFKYRKGALVKQGFDKDKSEHEIMLERGISRIYDCGTMAFEMKID